MVVPTVGVVTNRGESTPVLTMENPWLSVTTIRLGVAFGSRDDTNQHSGRAHLLEHLLMNLPVGEDTSITELIERVGGYANAYTNPDQMHFIAQVAPEDAETVFHHLLEAILHPVWQSEILDQERRAVLRELTAIQGNAQKLAQLQFLREIFAGHPLGNEMQGRPESIENISLPSIMDAYNSTFRRRRRVLAIASPTALEGIKPAQTTENGLLELEAIPLPTMSFNRHTDVKSKYGYQWLAVGCRAPYYADQRSQAFRVLSALMGGNPSSMLYDALRRQHALSYEFASWYRGYLEAGTWRVLVGANAADHWKILDIVKAVLSELASQGPSDEQLAVAKKSVRLAMLREHDIPRNLTEFHVTSRLLDPHHASVETQSNHIDCVTASDILAAAAWAIDNLHISITGEADDQ